MGIGIKKPTKPTVIMIRWDIYILGILKGKRLTKHTISSTNKQNSRIRPRHRRYTK